MNDADPAPLVETTAPAQWILVGPVLFVVGQLLLLIVIPDSRPFVAAITTSNPIQALLTGESTLLALLIFELGLVLVLGQTLLGSRPRGRAFLVYLVAVVVLGFAVVWPLRFGFEPWHAALTLIVVLAILLYGIHRYELVRLDLVNGGSDT